MASTELLLTMVTVRPVRSAALMSSAAPGSIAPERGGVSEHSERIRRREGIPWQVNACAEEPVAELIGHGMCGYSGKDRADRPVEFQEQVTYGAENLRQAAAPRHRGGSRLTVLHMLSKQASACTRY